MYFLHFLVRVLIGWVLYQPIVHNNTNTRYLEVYTMFILAQYPPSPVHYYNSSKPESLKAAMNEG